MDLHILHRELLRVTERSGALGRPRTWTEQKAYGDETITQRQVVCLTNGLEKLPKEASLQVEVHRRNQMQMVSCYNGVSSWKCLMLAVTYNVKEEGNPRPETGVRSDEGGLMSEPESRWICAIISK